MKKISSAIAVCLFATGLFAGTIDGKWRFETTPPEGKGKGRTLVTVLDLKSGDGKLGGEVIMSAGKRDRSMDIQDGKVEGNRFSFTTIQRTKKKGEVTVHWSGMLEGDQIKGAFSRKGGRRGQEFTASRQ